MQTVWRYGGPTDGYASSILDNSLENLSETSSKSLLEVQCVTPRPCILDNRRDCGCDGCSGPFRGMIAVSF